MKNLFLVYFAIVPITFAQKNQNNSDTLTIDLQQITVTATRYSEKLMEIPYSVSVIKSDKIATKRNFGLDEIVSSVPGVLAQSRAGNQDVRLIIRGFGARGAGDRSNYGTSRGIRIMLDGIPETEPDGRTSFDLIETSLIENTEIIRSNSSALWGNASGGIINFSTLPDDNQSFIKLESNYGSFGFNKINAKAYSNYERSNLAFSISSLNFDGWREHSSTFRTMFNATLKSELDSKITLGLYLTAATNVFHVPGPLSLTQFNNNPQQANPFYKLRDERRHNKLGRIGATLDYQLDEKNSISAMTFVSPKYLQRSERGTFRDFTRYHIGGNLIYNNQMLLSSNLLNHLVVGIDDAYQDGAILFYSLSPANGRGDQLKDDKREGANTFGLFLQDEIMVGNKISFIAGARFDKITYYGENYLSSSYGLQEKQFSKITPKFGITYLFNPYLSFYSNIGGGVEVPAGNETDPSTTFGENKIFLFNQLLEPIISTTYEIGMKYSKFFSNDYLLKSIFYEIALYTINIENDIIPYLGGKYYFTAGKTNRKGIEFGTEVKLNSGFEVKGSFTFSQNKYLTYLVDSVHYGNSGKFANYSNNKSAGVPEVFYNINLTYSTFKYGGLFTSFSMNSVGNYFADDANKIKVPSYRIFNLSFGMNEGIKILNSLFIKASFSIMNLFNEKYAASAFINPDTINNEVYYLEPGLPKNYVINISFRY